MVGNWLLAGLVTFSRCLRSKLAKRARRLPLYRWPIKTILLSGAAYNPLSINAQTEPSGSNADVLNCDLVLAEAGAKLAKGCGNGIYLINRTE